MNNKKVKIPIIERISIISLDNSEIHPLLSKNVNELNKIKSKINGNVINTYSSIHLTEQIEKDFISKLPYVLIYNITFISYSIVIQKAF